MPIGAPPASQPEKSPAAPNGGTARVTVWSFGNPLYRPRLCEPATRGAPGWAAVGAGQPERRLQGIARSAANPGVLWPDRSVYLCEIPRSLTGTVCAASRPPIWTVWQSWVSPSTWVHIRLIYVGRLAWHGSWTISCSRCPDVGHCRRGTMSLVPDGDAPPLHAALQQKVNPPCVGRRTLDLPAPRSRR
jgi:hypothetical protein